MRQLDRTGTVVARGSEPVRDLGEFAQWAIMWMKTADGLLFRIDDTLPFELGWAIASRKPISVAAMTPRAFRMAYEIQSALGSNVDLFEDVATATSAIEERVRHVRGR